MKKVIVSLMLVSVMAQLQALMPIVSDDPYEILEVSPEASEQDIRGNYLRLVKENHPDMYYNHSQKEMATKNTQKITEAYRNLMRR